MRRSLLLVAGVVLATPSAAQAAGTRTVDCDERSVGTFADVYTDARSVVVGPIAFVGLRSAAAVDGFLKSPLVLRPGRPVTVSVDRVSRAHAALRYAGGARVHTIRFKPCGAREADSRAGSERVTFWAGGFMVQAQPFCLRFTVTVDGVKHRRRVPIGGGTC